MKHHPLTPFKHRDFALYSTGLLFTRIGNEMQKVAFHWQMYLLTKSAIAMGMIGLATIVPLLLFVFVGGITADKFNRKYIILTVQTTQFLISLLLTIGTFLNIMTPGLLYLAIAMIAITWAFDSPARQSFIPHLVPKDIYLKAVSLNGTLWQTSIFIGPAIGGFIIDFWGIQAAHLINTLSFLPIIISLFFIKSPKQTINTTRFNLKSLMEAAHFIKDKPALYGMMFIDFFATFFSAGTTLMPIFATQIFYVGAKGLGLLYAAPAVGGIIGSLIFSSFTHIRERGKIVIYSVIGFAIATILFGLTNNFMLALFFLAITGATDVVSTVVRQTVRQLMTPDHMRGRMTATNMIFGFGGPHLGEVEAGIAAAFLGAPMAMIIGGAGTMASIWLIVYFFPQVYAYKQEEDK